MAAWIKMSLGMELGLGPGEFVLDGDHVAPPQGGGADPPKFSAHVYCDQTAGWMKLVFGMLVGIKLAWDDAYIIPGEFVLDGDPAASPKRGRAPSPILRVEVGLGISKLDRKWDALPVIANVVALEQQIILVKTRSESV